MSRWSTGWTEDPRALTRRVGLAARPRGKGTRTSTAIEEEELPMSANCGCGTPEDTQGDERNILWSQVVASAEANDITPTEAIQNMLKMTEQQG